MSDLSSIKSMLREIGAIDDARIELFAQRTRDRDVPVWRDSFTGVIFIDGFYVGDEEYSAGHYRQGSAAESYEDLSDTERRVARFESLYTDRSILDFGCGSGSFLRAVSPFTKYSQGVELQDSLREELSENGIPCFSALDSCTSPEVIFLFHVLEHLPNPLTTLIELRRKMGDEGGTLVVEVPHARDFLLAHAQSRPFIESTLWSQHLVLHTRSSLELLLRAAGFTSIQIYGSQRYSLANHFQWLIEGLPGGHKSPRALMETRSLRDAYEQVLCRMDATDTLTAIAQ